MTDSIQSDFEYLDVLSLDRGAAEVLLTKTWLCALDASMRPEPDQSQGFTLANAMGVFMAYQIICPFKDLRILATTLNGLVANAATDTDWRLND